MTSPTPANVSAFPFMDQRRITFYTNVAVRDTGKVDGDKVQEEVCSFDLKAVPSTLDNFRASHPKASPKTIEHVRQIIDWHRMPAWQQLQEGGMTLRPWPFPSYIAGMAETKNKDWKRQKSNPDWVRQLEQDVQRYLFLHRWHILS
jgi:hypothetical protein